MTRRTLSGIVPLMLALGAVGCSGSTVPTSMTAPSPTSAQAAPPSGWVYGTGFTLTGVSLFGVVSEPTPNGQAPIAGVMVYCDVCGEFGHTAVTTDANGYYSFNGDLASGGGVWLSGPATALLVSKEGYQDPPGMTRPAPPLPSGPGWRAVLINGDTRFDTQLVR